MPSVKSNLHVTVEYNGRVFTVNGFEFLPGRFFLKRGRSRSKIPDATNTEIFKLCRQWVANQK